MDFGTPWASHFIIFRYFLGIDLCIDFWRQFFDFLPDIAPKMDPVWHARRRRKGARNGSRHASAAGPPFFMIFASIGGHPFGISLAPFWHLFSEKKGKNDARMVPKKDVSSKWANKEATKGQKERKEGKGKKSKSGNQGVSEGGKEAKKGRKGRKGTQENHSTMPRARRSRRRSRAKDGKEIKQIKGRKGRKRNKQRKGRKGRNGRKITSNKGKQKGNKEHEVKEIMTERKEKKQKAERTHSHFHALPVLCCLRFWRPLQFEGVPKTILFETILNKTRKRRSKKWL